MFKKNALEIKLTLFKYFLILSMHVDRTFDFLNFILKLLSKN